VGCIGLKRIDWVKKIQVRWIRFRGYGWDGLGLQDNFFRYNTRLGWKTSITINLLKLKEMNLF
jgi:hypothetical protein